MTDSEITLAVSNLIDDPRMDSYVASYIEIAKSKVTSRVFPYADAGWDDVPAKYHGTVVDVAVYLINKRGAEGELSHTEAGVSRTYGSAGVPEAMLSDIVPMVGVPR